MVVMMIQVVDSDLQEKVQNLIEYRSLIKRIAMDNVAWILITWELAARFEMRSEADLLSKYLRDNNVSAKSYHSGILAKDRSRTRELFCRIR
ncbi:ATP-dependent DNA helicase Q-like 5 isoform X3 [Papaver somniferum]|uniref:ATP-dependent DNA helicase Q-like 5 isoform X3 n=1 Tax=Papaver somniferum TaxID=3469 RepID=UPI000E6FA013|nr:ATP-dependent DNA helicase Q-like 5 isoform X3 [Papaver somniferum]XP_026393878.1 ATP-dependent DNA helicase Q-like 5 isoform X3 [Papaver somniferum]